MGFNTGLNSRDMSVPIVLTSKTGWRTQEGVAYYSNVFQEFVQTTPYALVIDRLALKAKPDSQRLAELASGVVYSPLKTTDSLIVFSLPSNAQPVQSGNGSYSNGIYYANWIHFFNVSHFVDVEKEPWINTVFIPPQPIHINLMPSRSSPDTIPFKITTDDETSQHPLCQIYNFDLFCTALY